MIRGAGGVPAFEAPGAGAGDIIDLGRIDANTLVDGNQAFVVNGMLGTGQLWWWDVSGATRVAGNTDDDDELEFVLSIEDGITPASDYRIADFIL